MLSATLFSRSVVIRLATSTLLLALLWLGVIWANALP